MRKILAAIDGSPASLPVRRFAEALADLLRLDVDVITIVEEAVEYALVPETGRVARGQPVERLAVELAGPEVLLGVIGTRRMPEGRHPAGHVAVGVLERSPCPVVVVPPEHRLVRPVRRILLPLEGVSLPSRLLARELRRFGDAGVEVVPVHVFTESTTPAFWEGWHNHDLWAAEFGARYAPDEANLELRSGNVCGEILSTAAVRDIDLVVAEWKQDLSPGHATVIRALLDQSPLPVLLVPERDDEEERHGAD